MSIKLILVLGLIIIPFVILPGKDPRIPQMDIAVIGAMILVLLALFQGKLRSFPNRWLLFFLGYLLISYHLSPPPAAIFNANMPNFWIWKPTFNLTIFILMIIAISSVHISERFKVQLFTVMSWVGLVMALYVIAQALGVDQFCIAKPGTGRLGGVVGTMGNRTVVSPFIAMLIPMAWHLGRWWMVVIMAAAVVATESAMALGSMFVAVGLLVAGYRRRALIGVVAFFVVAGLFLGIGSQTSRSIHKFTKDAGRFREWRLMIDDWSSPLNEGKDNSFALTGLGVGSFQYFFPNRHQSTFRQAHNEYIQVLYETGLIGLLLVLGAMYWLLRSNLSFRDLWAGKMDRYRLALLSSFLCIAINAFGTFVWQIGPTIFYSAVVAGLLHNRRPGEPTHLTMSVEGEAYQFVRGLIAGRPRGKGARRGKKGK